MQNGHLLQQFQGVVDCEVTGIVPLSDKKEVLTVGWNRQILAYDYSKPDVSETMALADSAFSAGAINPLSGALPSLK